MIPVTKIEKAVVLIFWECGAPGCKTKHGKERTAERCPKRAEMRSKERAAENCPICKTNLTGRYESA